MKRRPGESDKAFKIRHTRMQTLYKRKTRLRKRLGVAPRVRIATELVDAPTQKPRVRWVLDDAMLDELWGLWFVGRTLTHLAAMYHTTPRAIVAGWRRRGYKPLYDPGMIACRKAARGALARIQAETQLHVWAVLALVLKDLTGDEVWVRYLHAIREEELVHSVRVSMWRGAVRKLQAREPTREKRNGE